MKNIKGYVNFVLHAHLPYIHHPESENYLEEEQDIEREERLRESRK